LQLPPNNYFAALFSENASDRKSDFANAVGWCERAIQFEPVIDGLSLLCRHVGLEGGDGKGACNDPSDRGRMTAS
jgi:hypothetical protein